MGWGSPALSFELRGMQTPQSFIVDPQTGIYFVSNMDGKPRRRDGRAFISKIGPAGQMIDLHLKREQAEFTKNLKLNASQLQ